MLNRLRNLIFPNSLSNQDEHFISQAREIVKPSPDIGQVRGQRSAKLALLIAAAGRHNLLMIGPPGEGKSFLASTIPGFLPRITHAESEELQAAYAASGLPMPMPHGPRPYRACGPTASLGSLIGGGRSAATIFPGDLALAHSGILFIDELPQFDRALIDALRQPLESGTVTVSRGGSSITWPARAQLIAAMNPCPCGYYRGDWQGNVGNVGIALCTCSESEIARYQARISGPILDRIDLVCWLYPLSPQERFSAAIDNQSLSFLHKVLVAQRMMIDRSHDHSSIHGEYPRLNCTLGAKEVFDAANNPLAFSAAGLAAYQQESAQARYSTRKSVRLARVSRTIADLYQSPMIEASHIATAAQYVSASITQD